MIANILCSFFGTIAFSILFNVQKKYYLWCGFTGMMGWLTYCAAEPFVSPTIASFVGTMMVVLLSRILAVYQKCPITVFLISGIFPMVPGARVYYTAYFLVTNQLNAAVQSGIESVKIAFAMVMGIVFIVSIPKQWFVLDYWKNYKKRNQRKEEEK